MSFQSSLALGQIGETLYYQSHEGKLEKLDGFQSDFKMVETGTLVELKTDYYAMSKTPNFFIERYSNLEKQTPGGPYQAITHGSTMFVYFYVRDLTFYQFETSNLIEAFYRILPTLKPTEVRNSTYITQGYLVPRVMLKDIYQERKIKLHVEWRPVFHFINDCMYSVINRLLRIVHNYWRRRRWLWMIN